MVILNASSAVRLKRMPAKKVQRPRQLDSLSRRACGGRTASARLTPAKFPIVDLPLRWCVAGIRDRIDEASNPWDSRAPIEIERSEDCNRLLALT